MSNERFAIRLATLFRIVKVTGERKLALHIGNVSTIADHCNGSNVIHIWKMSHD